MRAPGGGVVMVVSMMTTCIRNFVAASRLAYGAAQYVCQRAVKRGRDGVLQLFTVGERRDHRAAATRPRPRPRSQRGRFEKLARGERAVACAETLSTPSSPSHSAMRLRLSLVSVGKIR